ncbi:MAG: HPr family phosphocarrier protein [Desulfohalobiaceae bacterium]|nr:HPr family phosphocarrier protein [Desulfohalobiaceae bacterium]
MSETISKLVHIRNSLGLHARPAALLAQEAAKFDARVKLIADEMEADAKSVLDILSLAAVKGKTVVLQAEGSDAREAVLHLEHFFKEGFGEN